MEGCEGAIRVLCCVGMEEGCEGATHVLYCVGMEEGHEQVILMACYVLCVLLGYCSSMYSLSLTV